MARPIDFSTDLDKKDSIRFVKELVRVDSLSKDSKELAERKSFLSKCRSKAEKVKWIA